MTCVFCTEEAPGCRRPCQACGALVFVCWRCGDGKGEQAPVRPPKDRHKH